MTDDLIMWVIYRHPSDFPDLFVARRWVIGPGVTTATREVHTCTTLEDVRAVLPPGLTRMPRMAEDDPVIVETWI